MTSWRWRGVVGLWDLSAIVATSQARGHVDSVTFDERHDRTLGRRLLPDRALEHFPLAATHQRVDALDLDVEELLHRFLDLRLGGVAGDLEHHLAALGGERRFLGDDRRQDDVVMARIGCAHLNRASNASTAALVSTSVCRRRMS